MTCTIDGMISNDPLDKTVVENKIFIYLERTNPALHKIFTKFSKLKRTMLKTTLLMLNSLDWLR